MLRHRLLLAAILLGSAAALLPATAQAATWMQVSCQNPDGSPASSEGWTIFGAGTPPLGSVANDNCSPGKPLEAMISAFSPVATGTTLVLQYTPPPGSSVTGGVLNVALQATGYGTGATAGAVLEEPQNSADTSNEIFGCSHAFGPCHAGTDVYLGPLSLPADRGGNVYLEAACLGSAASACNSGQFNGAYAVASATWAHLLLASGAAPQGTGFSGSALQRGIGGVAHLVFTATDPGGPGIYRVTASLDGRPVYGGTPNSNGGACVPVGVDAASGALMFDHQQPCPSTEVVDVPIPTFGLPDGSHQLAVAVTDAAQNTSTVLDQQISTRNPQLTPIAHGRRAVRAQFVISWTWAGALTRLLSIAVHRLPAHARLTASCLGRGCPRLALHAASGRRIGRLLRALSGRRYRAGDRLRLTVSAPGHSSEHVQLTIRNGAIPAATLRRR